MAIAFVYPGQGSQYVGMGKDLFEKFPLAGEIFLKSNELLGFELSTILFGGPEIKLKQTFITQPAIFVHSLAITKILHGKIMCSCTAGHSLGEYTAFVHAGALTFEDGLRLVKIRGELMQKAGEEQKGTMAAVIGLMPNVVESVCNEASSAGIVQIANINSPGQIVISGSVEGVNKAMNLAKKRGARRVVGLVVHGAFHSPLMEPAKEELKQALDSTHFGKVRIPVYSNVTGKAVTADTPGEQIRELLYRQLTSPVRWEECVRNMIAGGAKEFIEIGPGNVLQGLIRRINGNVKVFGYDKAADINSFIKLS
jgi:[acyl-carrier-protein] S-malonyltransferase